MNAIFSTLCGLLLCTAGLASAVEPLHVYVGSGQMPFANDQPGERGVFGDLMNELCQRMQRECQYKSVPWRRVQYVVAADPQGIVLNLGRNAEREDQFFWLLEVLPTPNVLASPQRPFSSLQDALQYGPVAVMAGTPRAAELNELRQPDQQVIEVNQPQQAVDLLKAGRVVAWYEIEQRIRYLWPDDLPALRFGEPINASRSYIAASPMYLDASALAQEMTSHFKAMQADGSWKAILEHYRLAHVVPVPVSLSHQQ